jgi:lysozyme family protein
MSTFNAAIDKTLEYEGGLSNDPRDPGGLTNFGIALNEHPEMTAGDIFALTRERAIQIYRGQYWNDFYDEIPDQRLANQLFDFGVTSGVHTAVQMLQGTIFLHGGPPLDGLFGPRTLNALQAGDGKTILKRFVRERIEFYQKCPNKYALDSYLDRTIDNLL